MCELYKLYALLEVREVAPSELLQRHECTHAIIARSVAIFVVSFARSPSSRAVHEARGHRRAGRIGAAGPLTLDAREAALVVLPKLLAVVLVELHLWTRKVACYRSAHSMLDYSSHVHQNSLLESETSPTHALRKVLINRKVKNILIRFKKQLCLIFTCCGLSFVR